MRDTASSADGSVSLDVREPAVARILAILRNQIVWLDYLPGGMLSESELARRFGTSRQPVREAFIKLQGEGLVQVLPQRGTVVMPISEEEVESAVFLRESVETRIAAALARSARGDDVAMLRRCLDAEKRARDDDGRTFHRLDDEFHKTLAQLCGTDARLERYCRFQIARSTASASSTTKFHRSIRLKSSGTTPA